MAAPARRGPRGLVGAVGLVLLALVLRRTAGGPVRVGGLGMAPRLCPGDLVWVDRAGVAAARPGAVVAWRPPGEAGLRLERVVAGPGSTVELSGGALRVDGEVRTTEGPDGPVETWEGRAVPVTRARDVAAVTVPEGRVYLLGDERRAGGDSRAWGAVAGAGIVGRVRGVLWRADRGEGAGPCERSPGMMR